MNAFDKFPILVVDDFAHDPARGWRVSIHGLSVALGDVPAAK